MLAALIEHSVRVLQANDYTPVQLELALAHVYGVDTVLIDDSTYFVVESDGLIAACGGWSKRATLYGGDRFAGRSDDLLDPHRDAAKIRAFFVFPEQVRRGLASMLLDVCEAAAVRAGFARAELGATLAGVPFYAARGYRAVEATAVPLPGAQCLPIVRMERNLGERRPAYSTLSVNRMWQNGYLQGMNTSTKASAPSVSSQSDPVAWLMQDHQMVRRYLEGLRTAPASSRPQLLEELKKILTLHNAIEENLVYPTLAKIAGQQNEAFELYHQTAEADVLLYTVNRAVITNDEALFSSTLPQLIQGILEHVQVEETSAFPALEAAPPAEMTSLAQQIRAFRAAFGTPVTT